VGLVDLTQPFSDGMFSLGTLPRVNVDRLRTIEEDGVNVTTLACSVHSGTHLDAPCHFIADGRDAASLALDDVCGEAICISVNCEPLQEITAQDLEREAPDVRPGDIVMVNTGWGAHFAADPERYHRHPFLSEDAAQWLVDRCAKMVALDIPTPDRPEELRPPDFAFPIHHILLGSEILVAEHLANLDAVTGRRVRAYAFPIPIVHSDGAAVRFVAEV
jgi:arylformamidase